jgi:hypothetical protein
MTEDSNSESKDFANIGYFLILGLVSLVVYFVWTRAAGSKTVGTVQSVLSEFSPDTVVKGTWSPNLTQILNWKNSSLVSAGVDLTGFETTPGTGKLTKGLPAPN